MSTLSSAVLITIIVTTFLILLFVVIIVRFIFLYQSRRHLHEKEVAELRESFNQTLLQSKLEIQEQTLDHISKELHANFSHLVSLININLSEILPQGSDAMKDSIVETKSLAKQLLSELKALSASLNTDHIMHIGFTNALNNELDRLGKIKKYNISITRSGEEYRLSPEHEIILFRLCQEVFNNIVKYAKATSIQVSMDYLPDFLRLEITDNGIGFDVEMALSESAKKESTGILNIKKRAKLINAEVYVKSKENDGTSVEISIPKPQIKK
jgi:signal transduction histidine kinase